MSEISSAIMGTVNLYLRGKYAAAQSAIAAMGAKFIHPIEPECPKNPVTIRNTTDAITRRSAGIIPQNLSGRCDMQREDGGTSRGDVSRKLSGQRGVATYFAAASALLSRALRRLAAFS